MSNKTFKVGMLVEHPARPQWGPGKVMAVDSSRVHVVFRDELESKAKAILTDVAPLTIAAEQTDDVLDRLPLAAQQGDSWILPKNYERLIGKATVETSVKSGGRGVRNKKTAAS